MTHSYPNQYVLREKLGQLMMYSNREGNANPEHE